MSTWYYTRNHKQMGPVSQAQLQDLVLEGFLRPEDLIWRDGMPEWVQADANPDLFPPEMLARIQRRTRGTADAAKNLYPNGDFDDDLDENVPRPRKPLGKWLTLGLGLGTVFLAGTIVGSVFLVRAIVVRHAPIPLATGVSRVAGNLMLFDRQDPKSPGCARRIYTYPMVAGTTYTIDMESTQVDALLRLEDPTGREVAMDDDSGGGPTNQNARIIYLCTKTGLHRIMTTTCDPHQYGNFVLKITP